MSVWICAEMASAHDGSFDKAKRLIDAAVDAGCDAVKASWWSHADTLADRRKVPDYYRAIYRKYQISLGWLPTLREYCAGRIEFGCSVYIAEDVAVVASHVDFLKVASFEVADDTLMREAIATGKRVIASLGMCSAEETRRAVERRDVCRGNGRDVDLLLCTSAYPCPIDSLNLAAIRGYNLDGLSDHSADVRTGGWAVEAGARVLEAHAKLDDTDRDNPDYAPALNPAQLHAYVYIARHPHMAGAVPPEVMGTGVKAMQDCERECAQWRVKA